MLAGDETIPIVSDGVTRRSTLVALAGGIVLFLKWCKEDRGNPGSQGYSAKTLAQLKAAPVSVTDRRFAGGAVGDGVTDSTDALNAAFAYMGTLGGGQLLFPPGVYIVSEQTDATACSNVRFVGPGAWIKAADNTDFPYLMSLASTRDVLIDQLSFDANKDGRQSSTGFLRCLVLNFGQRITVRNSMFKNTLGIVAETGASSVALVASGGVREILVDGCRFLDCGNGPSDRPSDAVFIRGTNCKITNCYAENITDHAYVLEGCNYCQIVNCEAKRCTSIAAISNDTNSDCRGNLIHGITGTVNYLGSFGGAVGAYAGLGESTGALMDCRISNINIRAEDDCAGGGAGLFFSGKIQNIEVGNVRVDAGNSVGAMNHTCIIECDAGVTMGLTIKNSEFRGDGGGAGIRMLRHVNGVVLENNRFEDGEYGIFASENSQFIERDSTFVNCVNHIGLDGAAKYYGTEPQT